MANDYDHPYQEFTSKRGLFHHLRVDHGFDTEDLPDHYFMPHARHGLVMSYGHLLADHEEFHTEMGKKRREERELMKRLYGEGRVGRSWLKGLEEQP